MAKALFGGIGGTGAAGLNRSAAGAWPAMPADEAAEKNGWVFLMELFSASQHYPLRQ